MTNEQQMKTDFRKMLQDAWEASPANDVIPWKRTNFTDAFFRNLEDKEAAGEDIDRCEIVFTPSEKVDGLPKISVNFLRKP